MATKVEALNKSATIPYHLILPVVAFLIPLLVSGPQLLTGTIVNCFLFLSASYFSKKNQYIVAIAPSIGALLNGLVFGRFTPYLAYFLPLIWISNSILIKSYEYFNDKQAVARILISSILKAVFLFAFAVVFFKAGIVPKIFLTAMGVFQFLTAILGGIVFLGIRSLVSKNERHR